MVFPRVNWPLPSTDALRAEQVIQERWPEIWAALQRAPSTALFSWSATPQPTLIVEGIHLSSGYDRAGEAQLQARLAPEDSPQVWVYGPGMGALPRLLLQRPNLTSLPVVLLNQAIFALLIRCEDQSDWLADPRVSLHLPSPQDELQTPFVVAPALLKGCDQSAARLRDLIAVELDKPFLQQQHQLSEKGLERLQQNRAFVAQDEGVEKVFQRHQRETIWVAGAGPTLSDQYERLRTRPAGEILIAVDAALLPLVQAGIVPDFVVVADEKPEIESFFAFDKTRLNACCLVYFPGVGSSILVGWPGPRLVAYPQDNTRFEGLEREFPHEQLFLSGSVIHPALDLAVQMGAEQVVLCGADFGYPRSITHVAGAVPARPTPSPAGQEWVMDGWGQRLLTRQDLCGHLRELEGYLSLHAEVRFFNTSRDGAEILGTVYLDEPEI